MGSKPNKVKAPKFDPSGDLSKMLSAYQATMPDVLSFEQQFRPQFQGLNLGDISAFLQGSGGQQGIFGLGQQATQQSQEQLAAARQAELQSMQQQAGMARGVSQALSPEQAGVVGASTSEAMRARQSSYGLNPQEQREATQAAREAFGARGMLGSNASVAGEVLNREQSLFRKRQEAAQAEQQAFNMAGQFYTQPGFSMLGSQPLSYQTGQQQLGLGLGAIGAGTPQLFSPDAALNLGAANRQNMLNAQMAQAQANASRSAGIMGGLGALGGGLAQGAGAAGGFGALFAMSDRRVKHNIKRVGTTDGGLPVYTFKYNGSNMTHMGVMAQDVEKVNPSAVAEFDGIKAVNYSMIQ
jgi:peptidoglycan hydrolase-like protein with peptidoglycan-binding domain